MAEAGDFTVHLNVEDIDAAAFQNFIENLRQQLAAGPPAFSIPVLCEEPREGAPPSGFFDVVLETNSNTVTFRFRRDNLYLIGFLMPNDQWMEFAIPQNEGLPEQQQVHLIDGSHFLPYTGEYGDLSNVSDRFLEETPVGYMPLVNAVNALATVTIDEVRARSLVTVAFMISEAIRFKLVLQFIHVQLSAYDENVVGIDLVRVIRSWGNLSERVLRDNGDRDYTFEMPQPNNIGITTLEGAIAALGILKYYCIQRRFPRDVSFTDSIQQAFGLKLAEVFSVRIDNIDGEDPGDLYGTILVTDGLSSQYLYNRNSNEYESIKPGEICTLTGPSRCISADDNFTIDLDLKDYDTFSPDDEVSRGQMTWNVYDFTNKYNVFLSQRIDGKYGSSTVNYAVFNNAVQATIEVTLINGDGEDPANVYGFLGAQDGLLQQEIRLFQISEPGNYINVGPGEQIPLSRWTVVVSLQSFLTIRADLYDQDTFSPDDSIAKGSAYFPPKLSGTSKEEISGEYGKIGVKVTWSNK